MSIVLVIGNRNVDVAQLTLDVVNGAAPAGTPVFQICGQTIDIDRLIAAQVAGGAPSVGTPVFEVCGETVDIDAIIADTIAANAEAGTDDDPIEIDVGGSESNLALIDGAGVGRTAYVGSGTYAARYFKFTLAAETSVAVSVTGNGSLLDTFMIMWKGETYDTREEWIPLPPATGSAELNTGAGDIVRDDDSGAEAFSLITMTLEAGTYLVEVTPYSEGSNANTVNFSVSTAVVNMTTLDIPYTSGEIAASGGTAGSPWLVAIAALANKTIRRVVVSGTPLTMSSSLMNANIRIGDFVTTTLTRVDSGGSTMPSYSYQSGGDSAATVRTQLAGLASAVTGGGPINFQVIYDT